MFIRVTIELDHAEDVTLVPEQALTRRNNQTGVFVIMEKEKIVRWNTVTVGIKENDLVQVEGIEKEGYVVTLGQQLLNDGSKIIIPEGKKLIDLLLRKRPISNEYSWVKRKKADFTTMVTLIVVILGVVSLSRLRIDLLPDLELPTVSIRTEYEGASPLSWNESSPRFWKRLLPQFLGWRI